MKKLLVLLFNFYFAVLSVFGQGNALYREIQQAKDANTYLPKLNPKRNENVCIATLESVPLTKYF